ncbi:hypothetical protein KP509_02G029400 [Ceratopteris richardii]|uniref:Kinesin motor domain-containing protein n=1 Tax=Ceratopteris richardii TaxID=49495 RepID=A0A8T2V4D9_CERRI|nr:hypothetical protein KP509_02G029400 [Ceratopteris richardii]
MSFQGMSPMRMVAQKSPKRHDDQDSGRNENGHNIESTYHLSSLPSREPLCPIPAPSQFGHGIASGDLTVRGKFQMLTPRSKSNAASRSDNLCASPDQNMPPSATALGRNRFGWQSHVQATVAFDKDTFLVGCNSFSPSKRLRQENQSSNEGKDVRTPSKVYRGSLYSEVPQSSGHAGVLDAHSNTNVFQSNLMRTGSSNQSTPRSTRSLRSATNDPGHCPSIQLAGTPTRNVSRTLRYTTGNGGSSYIGTAAPRIGMPALRSGASLSQQVRSIQTHVSDNQCTDISYFELEEDPSFWNDHNVQVIIRCRPLNESEIASHGYLRCLRQESAHTLTYIGPPESRFTFDHVACEIIDQEKLFKVAGVPMVDNCMSGYNSCMFAYGQTGSGKTHTMLGDIGGLQEDPSDNRGMTPRIFEYLFTQIAMEEMMRKHERLKFTCKCSFLEIYNEQITDLLDPTSTNLQMREDLKKGVYVESLTEIEVKSVHDVVLLLLQGSSNRKVAATNMNRESSRSHSVFTCIIESKWESDSMTNIRFGRLNLVDLAGSERQKSSGAEGERLKEAANINKSLSTLGLVIMILVDVAQGKQRHVPYRDSKLTFLLQVFIGGNSKTTIIANVSPSISSGAETLSTLKFAQRAKFIRNNAIINEDASGDVMALRLQIQQLKEELNRLSRQSVSRMPLCHVQNQFNQSGDILSDVLTLPGENYSNSMEVASNHEISNRKIKALEAVVVGSLRREREAENKVKQLTEEIQHLNCLVRQREDDAQFNKMMLRFREDKIKRLEASLHALRTGEFHKSDDECGLKEELELVRSRVDKNPELTRFAMENIRLRDQLQRMQDFYAGGEREVLMQEVSYLRDQLVEYLEVKVCEDGSKVDDSEKAVTEPAIYAEEDSSLKLEYLLQERQRREAEERAVFLSMQLQQSEEKVKGLNAQLEEAEQKIHFLRNELDAARDLESSRRLMDSAEELSCCKVIIETLESQALALMKESSELQIQNAKFSELLKEKEEEVKQLTGCVVFLQSELQRELELNLVDSVERGPSDVKEKLRRARKKLEHAHQLNSELQREKKNIKEVEHERDLVRSDAELETAEALMSLQSELVSICEDRRLLQERGLKAEQDVEQLQMKVLRQSLEVELLVRENDYLKGLYLISVVENHLELAKSTQEWELVALSLIDCLSEDNEGSADAVQDISRGSWSHSSSAQTVPATEKTEVRIDSMESTLSYAHTLAKEAEGKLRMLGESSLAVCDFQREKASMQNEVEALSFLLDEKSRVVNQLSNEIEQYRKCSGKNEKILVALSIMINRNSDIVGDLIAENERLQYLVDVTSKEVQELESDCHQLFLERGAKEKAQQELEDELMRKDEIIKGLHTDIEVAISERALAVHKYESLKNELDITDSSLMTASQQVEVLTNEVATVKETCAKAFDCLTQAEAQAGDYVIQIFDLEVSRSLIYSDAASAKESFVLAESRLAELELNYIESIELLSERLLSLESRFVSLVNDLTHERGHNLHLNRVSQEQNTMLFTDCKCAECKLIVAQKQLERCSEMLQDSYFKITELNDEKKNLAGELEETQKQAQNNASGLQAMCAEYAAVAFFLKDCRVEEKVIMTFETELLQCQLLHFKEDYLVMEAHLNHLETYCRGKFACFDKELNMLLQGILGTDMVVKELEDRLEACSLLVQEAQAENAQLKKLKCQSSKSLEDVTVELACEKLASAMQMEILEHMIHEFLYKECQQNVQTQKQLSELMNERSNMIMKMEEMFSKISTLEDHNKLAEEKSRSVASEFSQSHEQIWQMRSQLEALQQRFEDLELDSKKIQEDQSSSIIIQFFEEAILKEMLTCQEAIMGNEANMMKCRNSRMEKDMLECRKRVDSLISEKSELLNAIVSVRDAANDCFEQYHNIMAEIKHDGMEGLETAAANSQVLVCGSPVPHTLDKIAQHSVSFDESGVQRTLEVFLCIVQGLNDCLNEVKLLLEERDCLMHKSKEQLAKRELSEYHFQEQLKQFSELVKVLDGECKDMKGQLHVRTTEAEELSQLYEQLSELVFVLCLEKEVVAEGLRIGAGQYCDIEITEQCNVFKVIDGFLHATNRLFIENQELKSNIQQQSNEVKCLQHELENSCDVVAEVRQSQFEVYEALHKAKELLAKKCEDFDAQNTFLSEHEETIHSLKIENAKLSRENQEIYDSHIELQEQVKSIELIQEEAILSVQNFMNMEKSLFPLLTHISCLLDSSPFDVGQCNLSNLLDQLQLILDNMDGLIRLQSNVEERFEAFQAYSKDMQQALEAQAVRMKLLSDELEKLKREEDDTHKEKSRREKDLKLLQLWAQQQDSADNTEYVKYGEAEGSSDMQRYELKYSGLEARIQKMTEWISSKLGSDYKIAFTGGCELVLNAVENEVQTCRKQAEAAWRKLDAILDEKNGLEEGFLTKEVIIASLQKEIASLQCQVGESKEWIQEKLQDKEIYIAKLQQKNSQLEARAGSACSRLEDLEVRLSEQKEKVNVMKGENMQLMSHLEEVIAAKESIQADLEEVIAAKELIQADLDEKERTVEMLEEQVVSLNSMLKKENVFSLDRITKDLNEAVREKELAIKERDELHADMLVLSEQLEMAQQIAEEHEAVAIEARQIAEASKTLAEQREEEARLLERSIQELESTINALETQVGIVRNETERQRLMREDTEMELQALRHQMSMMHADHVGNDVVTCNWEQIQRDLVEKEQRLLEAQARIVILEKQCVEKNEQIRKHKNDIMEIITEAHRQAFDQQQIIKTLENMVEQRSMVQVPSNSKPTDRCTPISRGPGSPFKCIGSGLAHQLNVEVEQELNSSRQKIDELEAIANTRQKEIFMLNLKLAEAESMTHDVIRDLVGVKLDITNYATFMVQQQGQSTIPKDAASSEQARDREKELVYLKAQLKEFIEERESWLEEIRRRQAEMMTARVAAEKLRQRDQLLSSENEMLKMENLSQRSRLAELEEEVNKLSGQQNLQQRIHHHAKIKEENNQLRCKTEDLAAKLRRSEVLLSRVGEELARYREAEGRPPYIDFEEEQRLKLRLQEVEEEKIQIAQELLTLCTRVLQVAGLTTTKVVDHNVAAEALNHIEEQIEALETEVSDMKLKHKIESERRRLSELRSMHSPAGDVHGLNCQQQITGSP